MSTANRLSEATYLGTTSYAYDAADRLTSVTPPGSGAISHTYDANGNLTAAGADTFAWDYADRLVSAMLGSVTETTTYAGDGVRLSADRGGGDETHFIVDRNFALPQLAYETDAGGSLLRRYAYGLGPVSQSSPAEGTAFLHADGLGSISAVTDPAGDPLAWSTHQPFGALRSSGADIALPPLAFTGQYLDAATSLYHLRARQYDPATGRFLSTDPVAPALTDPYVGTYVYVRNMPTVAVDPSGEFLFLPVLGAIALNAAFGVGGYVAANAVVNVAEDVTNGRPLTLDTATRGLNWADTGISAVSGGFGGPAVGAIRNVGLRTLGGAGVGCAASAASQLVDDGQLDGWQTGVGCAAGAIGATPQIDSAIRSGLYGGSVSIAEGLANWVGPPRFGSGNALK